MKKIIFASSFFLFSFFLSFEIKSFRPAQTKTGQQSEEVFGIDVSHYQGNIDWHKVSKLKKFSYDRKSSNNKSERITTNSKVEFVFIKSTEGSTFVDKKFKRNLKGCIKYGIPRTGYHYYRFNSDPKRQAQNYIKNVPKSEINLPPVIDLEYKGNRSLFPSEIIKKPSIKKTFILRLEILCYELEKHYGQKPIFYTSPSFYSKFIKGNFPDNPIWISDLRPVKSPNCDWLFWQNSWKGQVQGITSKDSKGRFQNLVDINKFNGNKEEFYNLVNKK